MTRTLAVVAVVLLCGPAAKAREKDQIPASLADAYKKEYAFLEAEKRALQKRMVEYRQYSRKKYAEARAELESLQNKLLSVRSQADDLERSLDEAERIVLRTDEDADLVMETLTRAVESLGREDGIELPAPSEVPGEQAGLIEKVFESVARTLRQNGSVQSEAGEFFLTDGSQTRGTLVHLGRVATYGISDQARGALAPAGAGKLKLWHQDAQASAGLVMQGGRPTGLRAFLYESLEKAVEQKEGKTAMMVIQSGGVIAWVIVVLGGLALLLILARAFILLRSGAGTGRLIARLMPLVSRQKLSEAEAACGESKSAAGRVLKTTVGSLHLEREKLEDVVSEAILHEAPAIERFGSTIMVFAAVAPLLGLLGTVTGIISTFDVITEFGTGDPKLLSAGISEALVTTELGLMVAIPTLLLGTLLSGRARSILSNLERGALMLVNLWGDARKVEAKKQAESQTEPAQAVAGTSETAEGLA